MKAVGVFIAKDLQLYSVITDVRFTWCKNKPRYNVPSCPHFNSKAMLYETSHREIEIKWTEIPYLSLSTDSWSTRAGESYLTVVQIETRPQLPTLMLTFLKGSFIWLEAKKRMILVCFLKYKDTEIALLPWPKNHDTNWPVGPMYHCIPDSSIVSNL